jgi:N-acetylglucosaminyl-diphospho-decaprenol L-rhamnosyltransferase
LSTKNLGMGAGNNLGLRHIKTDYAFILNPDVVLEKDAIKEIVIASKIIKSFGIMAPISDDTNNPNYKVFKKDLSFENSKPFTVESVDGFAMLLNLKKIKKLNDFKDQNLFDENIFLYLENDDLCKRISKNFEKIFIVPKSKIKHLGAKGASEKYNEQIELSRNWHWIWSKFYFNKKHHGFLIATIDGLPIFFSAILKLPFYYLLNHKRKKIYYQRVSGFLNALIGKKSYYRPKIND